MSAFYPYNSLGGGSYYGRAKTESRGPHDICEVRWFCSVGVFPAEKNRAAVQLSAQVSTAADQFFIVPQELGVEAAADIKNGATPADLFETLPMTHYTKKDAWLVGPYSVRCPGPRVN